MSSAQAQAKAVSSISASGLKMLLIMNDVAAFKDRIIFLHSQAVAMKATLTVPTALASIASNPPDIILISWDLKKANVKKFYELLTKSHGFICVLFSEDRSPLRVSALLNSGVQNLLVPPVSGKAILDCAIALTRHREEFVENFDAVDVSEIPGAGNWEMVAGKRGKTAVWKLTVQDKDKREEYLAKSVDRPVLDKKTKTWQIIRGEGTFKRRTGLVQKVEAPPKQLDGSVALMADLDVKKMIARATGDAEALGSVVIRTEAVESNVLPANTAISPNSKSPHSIMAKSVEVAVELAVERTSEVTKPIEKVTKGTLTMIKTANFKGYIVGANASDTADRELAAKVRENLVDVLGKNGEELGGEVTIQTVELDEVAYKIWAEQNAEFVVNSQHGADDVSFAFMASKTIMERPDGKTEIFSVDVEKGLAADKEINFDVFLHLPKNKKFVQYINKILIFTAVMKEKLVTQGIKEVFLRNEQFPHYEIYCAKNELDASIAKFKASPPGRMA